MTKWELIERIILSREALLFVLIVAIIWLVKRLDKRERKIAELYKKQEQLLIGALISEKIKNFLAKLPGEKKTRGKS